MELGALLGNIGDGSQSFESIGSWDISNFGTSSVGTDNTDPYSSNWALVSSLSGAPTAGQSLITYDYSGCSDVYQRWWFETGTHDLSLYFSAKKVDTGSSWLNIIYTGVAGPSTNTSLAINSGSYKRYKSTTSMNSSGQYKVNFLFTAVAASPGNNTISLDDITFVIDPIQLCPERNLRLNDELYMGQHQTYGGANPGYKWGFNKKWSVPIRNVKENQALLINQWWQDTRPLLWTFDDSDFTQQFIVTMTNNQTPMNNFSRPYHDEWQGTLELAAFDTSLVF